MPALVAALAVLAASFPEAPRKQPRSAAAAPTSAPGIAQRPPPPPPAQPAPVSPRRFGRFDLDMPFAALRAMPELHACADRLAAPSGRADCDLPKDADHLARAQLAWEEGRGGTELVGLRLLFDPGAAPALTDLEWQLTRGWGPPSLEQLRRERELKLFTLQWEDADHRATLEAQGPLSQPSRAVAIVFERKQSPLTGELVSLHPRPFPGFRVRWLRKLDFEGVPHALLWGTSLSPAQEAMGEASPAWAAQRSYVGLWRLEPATRDRPRRWRPLWERIAGGDDEDEPQRVLSVDARDVTGDGTPDVLVELTCGNCGATANEVVVKTVRAGKLVDLLQKRELYRAQVEATNGLVRIREPEGEDDQGATVITYAYDRGKGAFVLAREERQKP